MRIAFKINGVLREADIKPGDMLLEVLRGMGITSVKKSCNTGACGVCTILLDGRPIVSCSYLAAKADGHVVTTIEGVEEEAGIIGELMNDEGAVQCGFCTPGFILTVIALKNEIENPTVEDMKNYLVGNLCRCSGYDGQLRAVKKYLGVSR